jgi:hypothetical protein
MINLNEYIFHVFLIIMYLNNYNFTCDFQNIKYKKIHFKISIFALSKLRIIHFYSEIIIKIFLIKQFKIGGIMGNNINPNIDIYLEV